LEIRDFTDAKRRTKDDNLGEKDGLGRCYPDDNIRSIEAWGKIAKQGSNCK
jgi:hypothetical protein